MQNKPKALYCLINCLVFLLCWEFCSECWQGCHVSCHAALLLPCSEFCRRHRRLCREIMKTDTMLYFLSYVLRVLQSMVAVTRCQLLERFLLEQFCKECCNYVMSHWFTPPSQFYGDCWWLCSEDGELCWWLCNEDGELCWWLCSEDGELCWWLHSEDSELMPHWFTCPSVQSFVENAGDYAVRMVNNLLDMLTKGQHSRTNRTLEQVGHTHFTSSSSLSPSSSSPSPPPSSSV